MIQRSLFEDQVPQSVRPDWKPQEPPDLSGEREICLDTETSGLRWWGGDRVIGLAVGTRDGRCWYLPCGHAGGNLDEGHLKSWARAQLRDKRIYYFNAQFDVNSFYSWGIDLETQGCTAADVGHYATLLNDRRYRSSLDDIAKEYLGYGKLEGLDKTRMAEYHASEVEAYACRDVLLNNELANVLIPMLEKEELQRVAKLEDECLYATCEMERNGAPLDAEKLERWLHQSERDYIETLWALYRESGLKINPISPGDLRALFDKCGLPYPTVKVEKGPDAGQIKVTFDKAHLARIDHPSIRLLRRARRLASVRSKYLQPYWEEYKRNGKLRYALHQLRMGGETSDWDDKGVRYGRYSSSAYQTGDGQNIQQVAGKKFIHSTAEEEEWEYQPRELVVPESGLSCSGDADQIEYRLFAHYARPPKVMEAYQKDPRTNYHKVVQKMLEERRPITYELTKDVNFAGLFGAGLEKFSVMLGMTEDEARPLYSTYHNTVPEARALLKYAMRVAEDRGYVKTLLGRRARFPDKAFVYAALNRVIQGTAADEMKTKLVLLRKEAKYTGLKLRFTVHDEVYGDVPDEESAAKVSEVLNRQVLPTRVPLLWTVKTGPNWNSCKKSSENIEKKEKVNDKR